MSPDFIINEYLEELGVNLQTADLFDIRLMYADLEYEVEEGYEYNAESCYKAMNEILEELKRRGKKL